MNSDYIKLCVAQYFRYKRQCKLISFERPLTTHGWYVPDILVVNKDRKLIEIEVKVSLSDFKADAKKRIWKLRDNGHCAMPHQFYYAVPAELEQKVKLFLRPDCGLIRVGEKQDFNTYAYAVSVAKSAPSNKDSKPLNTRELVEMVKHQTGTLCSLAQKNYEAKQALSSLEVTENEEGELG